MPDLCAKAGLPRKTSHCLRKTTATRLFQANVEEKLIRERTGHRSNALFNYEQKSEEQEKQVSNLLGPPDLNKEASNVNESFVLDVSDEILGSINLPNDIK